MNVSGKGSVTQPPETPQQALAKIRGAGPTATLRPAKPGPFIASESNASGLSGAASDNHNC